MPDCTYDHALVLHRTLGYVYNSLQDLLSIIVQHCQSDRYEAHATWSTLAVNLLFVLSIRACSEPGKAEQEVRPRNPGSQTFMRSNCRGHIHHDDACAMHPRSTRLGCEPLHSIFHNVSWWR